MAPGDQIMRGAELSAWRRRPVLFPFSEGRIRGRRGAMGIATSVYERSSGVRDEGLFYCQRSAFRSFG